MRLGIPWVIVRMRNMPEYLWPILVVAAYVILMRWILPAFGVPT
jgi:hypothetical protein